MGENRKHGARFFPPKDLVYFWINTRHNSKAQTFFSRDNFPAERLRFFLAKT